MLCRGMRVTGLAMRAEKLFTRDRYRCTRVPGPMLDTTAAVRPEHRDQILRAGEPEDIMLLRIPVHGRPLSVVQLIADKPRLRPRPNTPLPAAESYPWDSLGRSRSARATSGWGS